MDMTPLKSGMVALLGLAALILPVSPAGVQAQGESAPPPCPKTGTYTADVDGAPSNGACRQFVDRMQPTNFNIPSGRLFDGLKAYLEQSGARGWVPLDLMMANICTDARNCKLGAIPTAGVSGILPPREALERLLAGTGVSYVQDQTGTFRFPSQKDAPVPGGRCFWEKATPKAC